jgi:hypothetical protein
MLSETAKQRMKAERQGHNPLVYICGTPQQIEEGKKEELIQDIPVIPEEYLLYYIDYMVRGQMLANWEARLDKCEPEVHRYEGGKDFGFPDGMVYPVWLLDIAMKTRHEANRKRK